MFRIRLHGRGGQGIKTGGRVLGAAFFLAGYEVQDAPRYGAERRGAPISSHVRAGRLPIRERGPVVHPDLVVVADDTLVALSAAGVSQGVAPHAALVVAGRVAPEVWRERLHWPGPVLALPKGAGNPASGLACAAAAAALVGVIGRDALGKALREEEPALPTEDGFAAAMTVFDALEDRGGLVREGEDATPVDARPDWVDPAADDVSVAAPDVEAAGNSALVPTGLWRTWRPAIDAALCHRCSWICGTLCPDGAIRIGPDRSPSIDLEHCKGCLVCVSVCPTHAIRALPERGESA